MTHVLCVVNDCVQSKIIFVTVCDRQYSVKIARVGPGGGFTIDFKCDYKSARISWKDV